MEIIAVTVDQILDLQKISATTFSETFAESNSPENMAAYLEEKFSLEKLMTELKVENSLFYFAKKENEIIGYLKLNFSAAQTEAIGNNTMEIERIYILQKFHGKKIGQLLFDKAVEIALQMQINYLWLGVWEKNERAIAFYEKNGFVAFDKHLFILGEDEQTDIMMRMNIGNI